MRKWIIALWALLLLGAGPTGHVARLGQTIAVGGPRVRPLRLLEDSRCPMEARCIWAGRVRLLVRVSGGKASFQREMEAGKAIQVFDGQLTLDDVMPAKSLKRHIKPATYRFSFSFAGGL